jgi:hypothetical protein
MSPAIASCIDSIPMRYAFKMRYQGNALRVWFTPEEAAASGLDRPLAEVPIVKDRWLTNEVEVLTYPPTPDEIALPSAQILFGEDIQGIQARYPNPEVAGGKIALVVAKKQQFSAEATAKFG